MNLVRASVILDDMFSMKIDEAYELRRKKDGASIYLKRITKEEWLEYYAPKEKTKS